MAGIKGRSGGPRQNSGGVRVGAGRKPSIQRFVGPVIPRGYGCWHEKPIFGNGKERKQCFICSPKIEMRTRKDRIFSGETIRECKKCSFSFEISASHQKFCGDACRIKFRNDLFTASASDRSARPCGFCSKVFEPEIGNRRRKFCSKECALRSVWREKQGDSSRRRAKKYGCLFTSFSKWKIFERDKWTCQICGIETPENLSGLGRFNSPELDHIVPLSAGGDHAESNVQCACSKCNRSKGSKSLTQFLTEVKHHGQRWI